LKQLHGVKPRKGVVVCWENDWAQCGKYAEVLELRSLLGFGRRVWIQNTLPKYQWELDYAPRRAKKDFSWTVSARARPGDIVLMYRAGSRADARKYGADESVLQSIANVFMVKSFPKPEKRFGYKAIVTQIASLNNPLRLEHMWSDHVLQVSPFVRMNMLGRTNATPYWYRLYQLILQLNPDRKTRLALSPFSPDTL
jgi:hypothetical protein